MDAVYSNFDHALDVKVMEQAVEDGQPRQHPAWNFCGYVTWDVTRQCWTEEIWQRHKLVETREHKNLTELISSVNKDYGRD